MKKGNKIIRTDPEVHERLMSAALRAGTTLNNVLRELIGLTFIKTTQKSRSEKSCKRVRHTRV